MAAARPTILDRSSDGLEVITRPDGSAYVDLQGRFFTYSVVKVDDAGNVATQCVCARDQASAHRCAGRLRPAPEE
jgi:hypothetical protein